VFIKHISLAGLLCLFTVFTLGCSNQQRVKYPEPTTIAVRNNSGISLYVLTLKGVSTSEEEQVRMGGISPLPRGTTQVIRRPSSPPPLPEWVIISWMDYD
jgi:hypothetical protein